MEQPAGGCQRGAGGGKALSPPFSRLAHPPLSHATPMPCHRALTTPAAFCHGWAQTSAVPSSPPTLDLTPPPPKKGIYKCKAQTSLQFWVPIPPSLASTDSCFPEAVGGISAVTLSRLEEAEGGRGISLSCAPPTLSLGSKQG